MSYARAVAALRLQATDRIPQTETLEHPAYIRKVSGLDPYTDPVAAYLRTLELLDLDWVFGLHRHAVRFGDGQSVMDLGNGRVLTDWGLVGSSWQDVPLFDSPEDVLRYRPLEDVEGRVSLVGREKRATYVGGPRDSQATIGTRALATGLYYTTLFQYGIMAFGWESFLLAAAMDPATFDVILTQFAELSRQNVASWVTGDCPMFMFHDDIAITKGLVFAPEWYRKYLFPKYELILEPAKRAGKRIVFVSDGNYTDLLPDLFAAGVDGVMVDERMGLAAILRRHGRDKVVIGNVDVQILTWGTPDQIRGEVRRCCDLGRDCPGYFIKCFGDLPQNIPVENLDVYFDAVHTYGRR
jgi:hypothetical protein